MLVEIVWLPARCSCWFGQMLVGELKLLCRCSVSVIVPDFWRACAVKCYEFAINRLQFRDI